MKHIIYILILFFTFNRSEAQNHSIDIELQLGPNISSLGTVPNHIFYYAGNIYNPDVGYSIYPKCSYFYKNLGISTGVFFDRRHLNSNGPLYDYGKYVGDYRIDYYSSYLILPLLITYRIPIKKVALCFTVGATKTTKLDNDKITTSPDYVSSDVHVPDLGSGWGIIFGAGVKSNGHRVKFGFELNQCFTFEDRFGRDVIHSPNRFAILFTTTLTLFKR